MTIIENTIINDHLLILVRDQSNQYYIQNLDLNTKYPIEIGIKRIILNFLIINKFIFILTNETLSKFIFDEAKQTLKECSTFIP